MAGQNVQADRRDQYLESKVLTAPAHRLHLMLIEGAIRFGRQAEEALRRGDQSAADEPLMRVIDIVGEMLAGVREQKTDLNDRIAGFYLFIFRRVAEAKINNDVEKLAEALQLLDFERETWQMACDQVAAQAPGSIQQAPPSKPIVRKQKPAMPHLGGGHQASTANRLSLEA
jgi:flagellar secretion chaperone FliS